MTGKPQRQILGVTIDPVIGGFLAPHDFRRLFWRAGTTLVFLRAASFGIAGGAFSGSRNLL